MVQRFIDWLATCHGRVHGERGVNTAGEEDGSHVGRRSLESIQCPHGVVLRTGLWYKVIFIGSHRHIHKYIDASDTEK